jgi:hypothetical protein
VNTHTIGAYYVLSSTSSARPGLSLAFLSGQIMEHVCTHSRLHFLCCRRFIPGLPQDHMNVLSCSLTNAQTRRSSTCAGVCLTCGIATLFLTYESLPPLFHWLDDCALLQWEVSAKVAARMVNVAPQSLVGRSSAGLWSLACL